jgi:hypothetical protein
MSRTRASDAARDAGSSSAAAAQRRAEGDQGAAWRDLQQSAGNQAVARLLEAQAALPVAPAGGAAERAAEREAERAVAGAAEPAAGGRSPAGEDHAPAAPVARQAESAFRPASASRPEHAPRPEGTSRPESAADLQAPFSVLRDLGPGRPLDAAARAAFEPHFGPELGGVRLHDDGRAAEAARRLNARAFTAGRDLVFGAGELRPREAAGSRLLAHELAHVAQQSAAPAGTAPMIQRQPLPGKDSAPLPPGDSAPSSLDVAAKGPAETAETVEPLDLGPDEELTAKNPKLAAIAGKLTAALAGAPQAKVAVTGTWDINVLPKDAEAHFKAQDEERAAAARRAKEVKQALVALGVPAARIEASGMEASMGMPSAGERHRHVSVALIAGSLPATALLPGLSGVPGLQGVPGLPGLPGTGGLPPLQPATTPPTTPVSDSKIEETVKKAITLAKEGVGIKRPQGHATITVQGPSIGLVKKGFEATGTLSWGGTLGVETSYQGVHFAASLSAERWEMHLSFPGDTPVPMLGSLAKIFSSGEAALRSIAAATATFKSLDDIGNIKKAVKPHLQPVKDAVEAAQGILGAQPGRMNLGVSLSGPGPSPVPGVSPAGFEIKATLTIIF